MTTSLQAWMDNLAQVIDEIEDHVVGSAGDDRYAVSLQTLDGMVVMRIQGLVLQSPPVEFGDRVRELLLGIRRAPLLLDLTECRYLCSGAVSFLVECAHGLLEGDGQVLMLHSPDKVASMLQLVGMDSVVLCVDDTDMARQFFEAQGLL